MLRRVCVRTARWGTVFALSAALFGCSMHPLTEDVARKNTFDIVEKIRCEAAEALRLVPANHPLLSEVFVGYDFDFDIT
jgi:hypothetical protein